MKGNMSRADITPDKEEDWHHKIIKINNKLKQI